MRLPARRPSDVGANLSTALLVIAVLGLLVGPALAFVGARGDGLRAMFDGATLLLVVGLSVLQLAPHAIEHGGVLALGAGVLGLFLPVLLERLGARLAPAASLLGLGLLTVHAAIDGAALALYSAGPTVALGVAVAVHRLPVGFAVAAAATRGVGPHAGLARTWGALGLLIVATLIGFGLGGPLASAAPEWMEGLLEGAVIGFLLHTVLDADSTRREDRERLRPWSVLGAILAIVVLTGFTIATASATPGESVAVVTDTYLALALRCSPALLLGYAALGLLAVLPTHLRPWRALPPVLPLDAALLTVPLLGPVLALLRVVGVGALVGLLVAVLGWKMVRPSRVVRETPEDLDEALSGSLGRARDTLLDHVDESLPWVLLGILIAALAEPLLGHDLLGQLPAPFLVPLFTLVGLAIPGEAAGITVLAAIIVHLGASPGAGLAMLLAAPTARAATLGRLLPPTRRRATLPLGVGVVFIALVFGWGVDLLGLGAPAILDAPTAQDAGVLAWACLVGFAGLALLSLVRVGPRGWIRRLVRPGAA